MLCFDEYGSKVNPTILLLYGAGEGADEIYEPEKTVEELFALIKTLHKKQIA